MILVTDIVNCLGNDVLVALDEKRSVIPVRVMADRQQGLPSLKYLNTEISEVSLFDMPSLDKAFQDIDRLLICNSNFLQDHRSAYTNLISLSVLFLIPGYLPGWYVRIGKSKVL